MDTGASNRMSRYELSLPTELGEDGALAAKRSASLPDELLLRNVNWFCRLRWIAVGMLVIFGLVGFVPALMRPLGLRVHSGWPFAIAAILGLANAGFVLHARLLARDGAEEGARASLWFQIVIDLLLLTTVVHFTGSLETYVAFMYLVHITLSCIFFSRRHSLVVAVIAGALFLACVGLESAAVIGPSSVFADDVVRESIDGSHGVAIVDAVSALTAWGVLWYLISFLSEMVRERDRELARNNERLIASQKEKARHMLHTTHELKSPLAAVYANAQLLRRGSYGALPEEANKIVERIEARCQGLAQEIQKVLQLVKLEREGEEAPPRKTLDLADVMGKAADDIASQAKDMDVTVERNFAAAPVVMNEEHASLLIANIVGNAVVYSNRGGLVKLECRPEDSGGATAVVEDNGLGIPAKDLPKIFDQYYRTPEAARHNKNSTGLGLAIVWRVAAAQGVRVSVESAPGVGTRFTLSFPPAAVDGEGKKRGE